eukprot:7205224-Pyramimonas_sp.AAC.1
MMMVLLIELEPRISYRAARHSNRKMNICRDSLKYLDARHRSATRAAADDDFLDLTRADDELQSCSAQQSKEIFRHASLKCLDV